MQTELKIGFIPLTDCAPLIVAKEQGFFEQQGLSVELCKEVSWSNIRDKLVFGEYQAAHMLAPMLMATTLGLNTLKKSLVSAYSFGLNGNAISVSNAIYQQMNEIGGELVSQPAETALVLKRIVEQRAQDGLDKLRFAVVFPFSMHYYLLNIWLKSAGIKVNEEVEILVVPPSNVVQALEQGLIDGYCVGEPWNTHAVKSEVGVTVITGYEVWNNAPEKVLGVTSDWANKNQDAHEKLIWAMYQASQWLDDEANRETLIEYLSMEKYVNAPRSSIENALQGEVCNPVLKSCRPVPNFTLPFQSYATYPRQSHAVRILQQMVELNQVDSDIDVQGIARTCYLSDVYRQVLKTKGIEFPDI